MFKSIKKYLLRRKRQKWIEQNTKAQWKAVWKALDIAQRNLINFESDGDAVYTHESIRLASSLYNRLALIVSVVKNVREEL